MHSQHVIDTFIMISTFQVLKQNEMAGQAIYYHLFELTLITT